MPVPPGSGGFSFIEMAVAIVILGAVLVMTLRGAELIEAMRGFSTGYQLQQVENAVFIYKSTYNYPPGDDPAAPARFGRNPAPVMVGDSFADSAGDALIQGKMWDIRNPEGEQFAAWRDLRAANLVDGDPKLLGLSSLPDNAFGGVFGFDEGNLDQDNVSLCATRIPGRAAWQIDDRIDDGRISTGRLVATSKYSVAEFNHFDAPDSEPYDVEKEYIICLQLGR